MTDTTLHTTLTWAVIGVAPIIVLGLMFISAPYGRHERTGWGLTIPSRIGWIAMEAPCVLVFVATYVSGEFRANTVPLLLLAAWQVHYVHRTFIFPFRARTSGKTMPAAVALMALTFNSINAYINARWISHLGSYTDSVLSEPHLWIGLGLFCAGLVINISSDSILFKLRKPGETGYKIPRGGLYRWVSSPNYFGELLEWFGWAIACWSLAGLAFFLFTAANLVPRAVTNHRWYLSKFDDYPTERKIIVPRVY